MRKISDFVSSFKKASSFFLPVYKLAFDIGTETTRVGIVDKGIALREPSYTGYNTKTDKYLFFGEEAREIYGKSPKFIKVIKPIHHSIISDFDATVALLQYLLKKGVHPFFKQSFSLLHPQMQAITTISTASTEVEQRAMQEALEKLGISEIHLIEKPVATAFGMGLPVFTHKPAFIIDMGAGSIEMSVVISGGIVASKIVKNAGEYMDRVIINYLHLKYGIIIGKKTAENLKIRLLNLGGEKKVVTIRGKSLENGLPKSIRVSSSDIQEALSVNLNQIIDSARELIESIPPEIVDSVIRSGITITGGLSQIEGLDKFMSTDLKIPINLTARPLDSTIDGILGLWQKEKMLSQISI